MTQSSLMLGYDDFLSEVAYFMGYGFDSETWTPKQRANAHRLVNAGLRQVYVPPLLPGETNSHEWSWLRPVRTLTIRAETTGTLAAVPTAFGNGEWLLVADDDVFTSDMEGETLIFDDSRRLFSVVEYRGADRIRAGGDPDLRTGDIATGRYLGSARIATETTITATASIFVSGMIGDRFAVGSKSYQILAVNGNQVTVLGNALTESGAFSVNKQSAVLSVVGVQGGSVIQLPSGVARADMAGDTVTFDGGGGSYTIAIANATLSWLLVSGTGPMSESAETVTISKSGTILGTPTGIGRTRIHPPDDGDVIVPAHIGMFFVLVETFEAYEIISVDTSVQPAQPTVRGIVNHQASRTFFIAHAAGETTGAITYDNDTGESTIAITSGSPSLTSSDEGKSVRFTSGKTYEISQVLTSTTMRVAGDAAIETEGKVPGRNNYAIIGAVDQAAGDTFTVTGAGSTYELPDDFGSLDGPLTFDEQEGYYPVDVISEVRIRDLQQAGSSSSRPQYAALRPKERAKDEQGRLLPQRQEVIFWPTPDSTYHLTYRYTLRPNELSAANPHPYGGPEMSELYKASMLAKAELERDNSHGPWHDEFMKLLQAAINNERQANAPDYYGYNANVRFRNRMLRRTELRDTKVTYKGVQY